MYSILYYGAVLGILASLLVLLAILRVDPVFYWTFTLLGGIYMSVSVWEALDEDWLGMTHVYWINGIAQYYWFTLWWVTIALVSISFFIMYCVYQIHISNRIVWDKTIALGLLIAGCAMVFGVAEDFGVFTLWGFEHFNLVDAPWHQYYIANLFPAFYLWLIPGLLLVSFSLGWSILHRGTKRFFSEPLTRFIRSTCPPNEENWLCAPAAEWLGVGYQLCVTKKKQLCLQKD